MPSRLTLDRDRAQRIADSKTRTATVVRRRDEITYIVEDVLTKQQYWAAVANPQDSFTPGTRIKTERHTTVTGSGHTIMMRAPEEQRGVALVPREATSDFSRVFVSSVVPYPVRLGIGDTVPQELEIRGYNLSQPPTYEAAEIVDDTAPVITQSLITCSLVAQTGCAVGLWNLVVHGKIFYDAIETYEMPPFWIYLSGYQSAATHTPSIVKINPNTWVSDQAYQGAADGTTKRCLLGIASGSGKVRSIVRKSGTNQMWLLIADQAGSGVSEIGPVANIELPTGSHTIAWNGSVTALCCRNGAAYELVSVTDAGARTVIATLPAYYHQIYWDGTYYWIIGVDQSLARVTTGGSITYHTGPGSAINDGSPGLVHSGNWLYVAQPDDQAVRRVNRSTVADDSLADLSGFLPRHLAIVGNFLYASYSAAVGNEKGIKKINLSTLAVVGTVITTTGVGNFLGGLSASPDGATLYAVIDATDKIHEIDLSTFTLTATRDPNPLSGQFLSEGGNVTA